MVAEKVGRRAQEGSTPSGGLLGERPVESRGSIPRRPVRECESVCLMTSEETGRVQQRARVGAGAERDGGREGAVCTLTTHACLPAFNRRRTSRVLRDDDENASRFCRPTLHLLARQTDTQPKM